MLHTLTGESGDRGTLDDVPARVLAEIRLQERVEKCRLP